MGRQGGAGPVTDGRVPGVERHGRLVQWRRHVGNADLAAVPEVRRALRELLRHWGEPGASDVAELLASELVTNALIHTEHGAVVSTTMTPSTLRVEVRDFATSLPTPFCPTDDDGTHGRGLVLVQALADAWGVLTHGVGKVVWFELSGGPA
ncbi:ATP-binding protein [Streptomyces ficellus]|uniref:ATP-binding protein n=1 Tax=Streptomyces ficellus TaxID=1977088 RepID=A0A6I6FEM7_9ACTN|nr:ATP-binding protein [Streptomyces ficellus]QGV82503.1 ATP-binding protein [Streptomyces ficellus]